MRGVSFVAEKERGYSVDDGEEKSKRREDDDGDSTRPESGEAHREADGLHGWFPSDLRTQPDSRRKTPLLY